MNVYILVLNENVQKCLQRKTANNSVLPEQ